MSTINFIELANEKAVADMVLNENAGAAVLVSDATERFAFLSGTRCSSETDQNAADGIQLDDHEGADMSNFSGFLSAYKRTLAY